MSTIMEDLQVAAKQAHLINLYQANSEVVYTGYIDSLAPDGVVMNTYDAAGVQDGAVFMRYDVIDEVEMMSEDLDNMAFRLENAAAERLNSVPQEPLHLDDRHAALSQIMGKAVASQQVVLLVLANNDKYIEGQVTNINSTNFDFKMFDKFNFRHNDTQSLDLDAVQIIEFRGNELLLESTFVKTKYQHEDAIKISGKAAIAETLK